MSKIIVFALVTFLAAVVLSLLTGENKHKPNPGFCKYKGINIPKGETVPGPIGECTKVTCVLGKRTRLTKLICPDFQPAPGCHVGELNLTLQYPKCCSRQFCPEGKAEER